ncbi:MAG: PEP-utilizing enzyme [Azospirillaceae bacterium]|nr:PEP-utilizing enzyme [Azospirillaceae bacterium]
MTELSPEHSSREIGVYSGRATAPGIATGPLVRLERPAGIDVGVADPAVAPIAVALRPGERQKFLSAADVATAALSALAEPGGEGAAILAFQIGLLSDDELIAPVFAAIGQGMAAPIAWSQAIGGLIAEFAAADDEVFAARASDLADLRDRVLVALTGGRVADDVVPEGAIIFAEDLPPSRFLAIDWNHAAAVALAAGSPASHVAMLARSRGVPMVTRLGAINIKAGALVTLDGDRGRLEPAAAAAAATAGP